jgi:uncharacterized protein (TIGR03086 family)
MDSFYQCERDSARLRHTGDMDLDDLVHAQSSVSVLLAGLGPDDWTRPTPCEDWDIGAVVRHLTAGERAFTTSLGGVAYDLAAIAADLATVSLADLPATYDAGAVRLREALASAGGGTFPTGIGPMPAAAVAELRTIEALTHGWDVARAVGAPYDVDAAVAERAIEHSLALMERLPPDRTPFGPPQPAADDAPAIDRLAALLGRSLSGG